MVAAFVPDAPDRLLNAAGLAQNNTAQNPPSQPLDQSLAPGVDTATAAPTVTEPILPTNTPKASTSGAVQPTVAEETKPTVTVPAPTSTIAPTAKSTDTPEVDSNSPAAVVQAYADRWSAGDYSGLYDLLSSASQQKTTKKDFVD